MPVDTITSLPQFQSTIKTQSPTLIDFYVPWCKNCKAIAPVFDQYADEIPNLKFYRVDVEAQPDIAEEVGVRVMPTIGLYRQGEKMGDMRGADQRALRELVEKGRDMT